MVIGKFQEATPLLIRSAIAAASDGFPAWRDRDWKERTRIIQKTGDILDSQKFLLAALITCESGKNRYEAVAEAYEAADMLRFHAEIYKKQEGFVISTRPESAEAESRSIMRPYGAWAVISPFNFPLSLAAGMAGAALITGNTIVLKPTGIAPFSALNSITHSLPQVSCPCDPVYHRTRPCRQIVTAHPTLPHLLPPRAAGYVA
jgi:1-pyrroline-5-carboxylate dehydrogenase